ncbi:MAG TPA: transcriptional regulator, partial [Ruminococcaceae bacterium]|nr:transcriptional regulator [Oscillospiraceae bacterium]
KYKHVKSDEMLIVLPKNHRLAKRNSLSLEEIADEPFIMLEEGEYSEPTEAFERAGIKPNIHYTLHDDYAIMTMVESGLGVSILAELVLKRTSYDITCIPVNPPIIRNLAVAYKDKETIPIASRRFIDFITENKDKLL